MWLLSGSVIAPGVIPSAVTEPKFSLLGDYYGPVLGLDCGGPLAAGMNVIR
jgi:hypothetical protein